MGRITLSDLDKKLDLLLQEQSFSKTSQEELKKTLHEHAIQDEQHFAQLFPTIAVLKEQTSHSSLFRSRAWGIFSNLVTSLAGFLLGSWQK